MIEQLGFFIPITLCPQKLALTSPTSGGHPVGIVRSRTKAKEVIISFLLLAKLLFQNFGQRFGFLNRGHSYYRQRNIEIAS
jgi:hypothetical protein